MENSADSSPENTQNSQTSKNKKPPGPIRWNAILPFTAILLMIGLYMHFFFDTHLRGAMEWMGYKIVGAEVNINKLETNFFKASLKIRKVEVTNSESPDFNSLEIGDIRFSMLWDALLRGKIVINEVAVEQIAFATPRSHRGKVKPPEPPSKGPSAVDIAKNEAIDFVQDEYSENVLGDIANILKGSSANEELQKIQNTLPSKAKLRALEESFKLKQKSWQESLKKLPQGPEIQALGDRLGKIKTKDFKTPQELEASIREFDTIAKDADGKIKNIQGAANAFQSDLQELDHSLKDLDLQIKEDMKTLQSHFRIPKIDPKVLAKAVFNKYLGPYLQKLQKYKNMAYEYIPPNLLKKEKGTDGSPIEIEPKPHPRERGVSYEFGRPGTYPIFWLKRTSLSSKVGASPGAGDIRGEITNITSHQKLINRPTVMNVEGDFPENKIEGFSTQVTLDATQEITAIGYKLNISSFPIEEGPLIDSGDINLKMKDAKGHLQVEGTLLDFKNFKMSFSNDLTDLNCAVAAKDPIISEVLTHVFGEIKKANIRATLEGVLPKVNLEVSSDIGELLERAFNKELQAKIKELQDRIQKLIDQEIGKQRAEFEKQFQTVKGQIEKEIKRNQDQLEAQKKQVELKIDQSKKDAENQAQSKLKEAENALKKQIGDDGQKKLEDLKKKLGF